MSEGNGNQVLGELRRAWLAEIKITRASETWVRYRQILRKFEAHFGETTSPPLDKAVIMSWLAEQSFSDNSYNTAVSTIRTFYEWAVDEDYLPKNPARRIPMRKIMRGVPKVLTAEQDAAALLVKVNDGWRLLWNVARFSGLRVGELISLNVGDIDLDAREIIVNNSKTQAGIRAVPIVDELLPMLRRQIAKRIEQGASDHDPLLTSQRGTRFAHSSARAAIRMLARQAGIEQQVSPHWLRRSFATSHINRGARVEVVSAALGHSDVAVTMRSYAFLNKATIARELLG